MNIFSISVKVVNYVHFIEMFLSSQDFHCNDSTTNNYVNFHICTPLIRYIRTCWSLSFYFILPLVFYRTLFTLTFVLYEYE